MDTSVILQQMIILFSLMAVGFLIRRLKVIDAQANAYLTKLLLRVTLPATLVSAISASELEVTRSAVPVLFLVIAFSFAVIAVLSWLAPLCFRAKREERGAYTAMGLFANVNFMGIPLTWALLGPDAMLYAILYNIVFNLAFFSLGMKLVGGKQANLSAKLFFSPAMLASFLSVLLFMLDIQLPYVMDRSLGLLGAVTTPMAMILLGSILGAMDLGELFRGWRVYIITAVRLLIAPIVVYLALLPFSIDPMLLTVILIMSASPMAISTAMFTIHYDAHQEVVGKGIFLSTLFSVVTLPILLWFLL